MFHFIDKNIDISEAEAPLAVGFTPKLAEVLVALLLLDAVDYFGWIVWDQGDFSELDEVDTEDQDSVLNGGGLIVRCEDPVVVACETVFASYHNVVAAFHRVLLANYDVVVLDQVISHFLQQIGHTEHLFVEQTAHTATLRVLAQHKRMPSEETTESPHSFELTALVGLLQPAVAPQVPTFLLIFFLGLAI